MFPGAVDIPLSEAAYGIVGAPLERSTTFLPGTRFGPERIRGFARGFEDYDRQSAQHVTELAVVDRGDVRPWQDARAYLSFLAGELEDVVRVDAIPLLLGGEHTVTIAGVEACGPQTVVCIDAHLDLRESFDDDPYSHATAMHHAREQVEKVIIIGARAASKAEWDRAEADEGITVISPDAASNQLEWVTEQVSGTPTYLSLDVDGIDPAYAPGTGTREPFGLSPETVRSLIEAIAPTVVGMDVVEVNDRDDGQTATLAASLLRRFILNHANACN